MSSQHSEEVSDKDLKESINEEIIKKEIPSHLLSQKTKNL